MALSSEAVSAGYAFTGLPDTKIILPKRFGRKLVDLRTITTAAADALRTSYPAAEGFDGIAAYFSYTAP